MEDEINIVDYLRVINKWKWILILFVILGATLMFIQTTLAPKLYKTEVTFLSMSSNKGNLSQAFSSIGLGSGGAGEGANVEVILKSRSLARMVAQNEDLKRIVFKELWDRQNNIWLGKEPSLDEAASTIQSGIKTASQSKIEVIWKDPEIAANIANAYAQELIRFLNQKSIGVNLQVLDEAMAPNAPFNKKSNLNAIIGGVVGLFIGIFFAFLFEYWNKIRSTL